MMINFGFTKQANGKYFHKIFCEEFDFSDNSVEGVICTIFRKGIAHGREEARFAIRKALGIESHHD